MTLDDYKTFIRYVKEKGLYTIFIKDAKKFASKRVGKYGEDMSKIPLKDYMLHYIGATEEIMLLIHWSKATFRDWQNVYSDYKTFYKSKLYENT